MAKNVFGLVHTMLDDSGALEPGGSIEVYDAGTTTARTVYSDRALTTTAGYQITADAAGRLPERWIADATLVKLVYKDSAGATLATRDYANDNADGLENSIQQFEETATGTGASQIITIEDVLLSSVYQVLVSVDGAVQPVTTYTVTTDETDSFVTLTAPLASAIYVRSNAVQGIASTAGDDVVTSTGSTTARTLAARFAEVANVLDFGAVGNGVTNDSTAVQAAATSLTNGGTLYFPPGKTYKLNTMITITASNVRVMCEGATIDASDLTFDSGVRASGSVFSFAGTVILNTTLAATVSQYARTAQLTSVTGIQAGDLIRFTSDKILYRNTSDVAYYTDFNRVTGISGSTVTLEVPAHLELTTSGAAVAVRVYRPISKLSVRGGSLIGGGVTGNLTNGMGQCGLYFTACADVEVEGTNFDGFQGINIYTDGCMDVSVDNLDIEGIAESETIVEGQNSGFYGVYFARTRRGTATRVKGTRVRHVIDAIDSYEITQETCRAARTHRGAFGSHEGVYDLIVSNCRAVDCYSGGVNRAFTSIWENNDFDALTTAAITTATMLAADAAGRLIVRGGKLRARSGSSGVGINSTGVYSPLIVEGVDITAVGTGMILQTAKIANLIFRDNTVDAPTGLATSYPTGSENLDYFIGAVIDDNTFLNYTVNAVTLRGSELITAPADRIYIRGNVGIPVNAGSGNGYILRAEGWYGDDIEVSDNTQLGDASAVVSICPSAPWLIRSAPTVERNTNSPKTNNTHRIIGENTSASYVSGATVLAGQILQRTRPGTATIFGYIVTTAGTEGTLSGVTTSVDIGVSTTTANLTGNTVSKVYPGCYITITGAGVASANLSTRVTAVAADYNSCTIETAASTTVSGATTAYRAPVFTAFATTS